MIELYVPGEPSTITAQQKGVNWKKRAFYTKAEVKAEARRITRSLTRWDGKQYVPVKAPCSTPLLGPVECAIKIRYPLTQAQAAKHAAKLSDLKFDLLHDKRPDFDNTIKLLLDVLTKFQFWGDDSQISDAHVHKRYGTNPGIWVIIRSAREAVVDSDTPPKDEPNASDNGAGSERERSAGGRSEESQHSVQAA